MKLREELELSAMITKTQSRKHRTEVIAKRLDFQECFNILQPLEPAARAVWLNQTDSSGSTYLHHALLQGEERLVCYFLEQGADVNAQNEQLDTPLHFACLQQDKNLMSILMQKGANRFRRNKADCFCHELVANPKHQQDVLAFLVQQEKLREHLKAISVKLNNNGRVPSSQLSEVSATNPLVTAVRMADIQLTERELPRHLHHLNLPVTDCRGQTPLFLAIQSGQQELARVLLDAKV